MTYFDLDTALIALGEGSSPIDAFSMAFGIPQCLLDIGKSAALALLPSSIVLGISDQVQKGRDSASEDVAKLKKKILLENGIFELDTDNGTFRFSSDFSKNTLDQDSLDAINKLGGLTESLAYALQFGSELYTNYLEAASIITGIGDCIQTYRDFLRLNKGPSSQYNPDPLAAFELEMARMQTAVTFINDCDEVLNNCRGIISDRLNNPALEPEFVNAELVSGLGFNVASSSLTPSEPVFRLVFGPPKSKKGQFLLSVDGLYYDSQSGGLPDVSGFVAPELAYKFEQAANLGGKGEYISLKSLTTYVDTIFDPDIIDDSPSMLEHYKADHFMQVLEGQKLKHIYDLSSQVQDAIDSGYQSDSAIIINLRQSLYSNAARHASKINRRKKQIEIAVKAPFLFGKNPLFSLGNVPINDFSYLQGLNLSVAFEKQKKLVLAQGEVSGVVLPLVPKYVKATESESTVQMSHLTVPNVGKGAIIFDSDSTSSVPTVLSLTDLIVKEGLIAVYNFLDGSVENPGSDNFNVLNCNTVNNYNNAQLCARSASGVFDRGLGIPYFRGITLLTSAGNVSTLGSYAQLPDNPEFQNLTYSPNGFTIEFWTHTPFARRVFNQVNAPQGYAVSSLYRLVLACENNGGINENINPLQAPYNNNSDIVRGMIMGFTRDRQMIYGQEPSNNTSDNETGYSFFLAPTRSVNASDVGFVNKRSITDCASGYEVCRALLPLNTQLSSGLYVSSINDEFMHFAVTVDPKTNSVKVYVDSQLMITSSIPDVFGVPAFTPPSLPSFAESNSFEYTLSSMGNYIFANGPALGQFFTPWIIGGGYTDGASNGFMNAYSGISSGLNGYLGSLKFYNKPLSINEVKYNYDGQKAFFKNIDL